MNNKNITKDKTTPTEEICEIKQDIANGLKLGRLSGSYYPKYQSTICAIKDFIQDAGGHVTIRTTPEGLQLYYTFNQQLLKRI